MSKDIEYKIVQGELVIEDDNTPENQDGNKQISSVDGTAYGMTEAVRRLDEDSDSKGLADDVKDVVPEGVLDEPDKSVEGTTGIEATEISDDSDASNGSNGEDGNTGKKKKKPFFTKKKLIIILIILAVLVVGITGSMIYAMSFIQKKAEKMTHIDVVRTDLDINPQVAKDLKNYRNIAILGIDTRNIKSNKGCRSDAIIIASINRKTNEVKLASVYRDSYLNIKIEQQFDKVTHAFAYGGAAETLRTLNRNMDLNIEEVVVVNWGSVADTVDALGGLEINVRENEIDEMNRYMLDTLGTVKRKTHFIKKTGPQVLDGVQAVTYARIRKGASGGDTERARRMRTLMNAALKKAKKLNIAQANKILDKMLPEIRTNMSDSDIMSMVINLNSYKIVDSIGWPYKYSGEKIDGVWYDVPVTLKSNVIYLHWDLFNQKGKYTPTDTVLQYSEEIVNQTGATSY